MRFRDRPIRRKLLLMTLTSSAVALVLASGGFLAWDVVQFRSEIRTDMLAQARIVGENVGPAITFSDERAAIENLAVLQLRPHVRMACLYDRNGSLFGAYTRDTTAVCPAQPPTETRFGWDAFDVIWPVQSNVGVADSARDRVGVLYIGRELEDVYARLRIGGATMVGLLLVAIGAAFLIASRMQRAIASPLLQLADTARTISTTRDYSLRASRTSGDEVGVVVGAFNDMLDHIAERTAELSKANSGLEREIEERRRIEDERTAALQREREANRLKDEFLATLSHELRTPLNAVLGWTRVLRTARVEPTTAERALESIERNARAQARLVEDLLEISRIVTGRLRLQVRDADLAAIIEASVEVVMPAAAAKRLHVAVNIDARPALTIGDPDRLQQVVWNLLSNAIKFTAPEGRVWITLERRDAYHLSVRDTGLGIDARFLPHVFEPFRQADGTASREHGGLGLGLAIAKQLVELHGGTIQVFSEGKGRGATFTVVLPSMVSTPEHVQRSLISPAALPPPVIDGELLRDVRILVVDDEDDARLLVSTALSQYGASVTPVASAAEAMAVVEKRLPDILVSDIGMPGEDGFSLIRRVREASEGEATVPAVALTAYASERDRAVALAAGFHAHVAKPFEPSELATLVAKLHRGK